MLLWNYAETLHLKHKCQPGVEAILNALYLNWKGKYLEKNQGMFDCWTFPVRGGIKYGRGGSVRSRHQIRLGLKEAFLVSGNWRQQKGGLLNKTVSNLSLLCQWQSSDGWNRLLLLLSSHSHTMSLRIQRCEQNMRVHDFSDGAHLKMIKMASTVFFYPFWARK